MRLTWLSSSSTEPAGIVKAALGHLKSPRFPTRRSEAHDAMVRHPVRSSSQDVASNLPGCGWLSGAEWLSGRPSGEVVAAGHCALPPSL